MMSAEVLPFLKWAGGKRWLIQRYATWFSDVGSSRYVEPFLGSAAVFFSLSPRAALLSDVNSDLIATYKAIRDSWSSVYACLAEHDSLHSNEYYYEIRAQVPACIVARAARFIYLNRTCFNGLYRVNKKGHFNVPIGSKSRALLATDDFEAISRKLSTAELLCGDFEEVIDRCGEGDFIFADPPYTVKHNNNGFIKYNENLFSWGDQERLKNSLDAAKRRGARIMVSNADHASVRELYKGRHIQTLSRHSVMASEPFRRRMTTEILIRF